MIASVVLIRCRAFGNSFFFLCSAVKIEWRVQKRLLLILLVGLWQKRLFETLQ